MDADRQLFALRPHLVRLPRGCRPSRLQAVPRAAVARRVRRVGRDLLRLVGRHRRRLGVEGGRVVVHVSAELGQQQAARGARDRGHRRRGDLPEHDSTLLPERSARRTRARGTATSTSGAGPASRPTTAGSRTSATRRRGGGSASPSSSSTTSTTRSPRSGGRRKRACGRSSCPPTTTSSCTTSTTRAWIRSGRCARSSTCRSAGTARSSAPTSNPTRSTPRMRSACWRRPTSASGAWASSSCPACSNATRT